jgi:hypothetical protein
MKKLFGIILFALVVTSTFGQSYLIDMKNSLGGGVLVRDTVTNTGTGTLTTDRKVVGDGSVTCFILVTKLSGTVAGTITLQGSVDNTNWTVINTPGTQTAITTITAADATARYTINFQYNPALYYRVSWTGAGTMSAWFEAKLMKR